MVDVLSVLIGISVILFVGFFSEFLFKKIHVPDIIFLLLLGFAMGPYGFKFIDPSQFKEYAPIFTTFALLFLLYDGSFNISLRSLARGAIKSLKITIFNFLISSIAVCGVMWFFGFTPLISLLTGFILGGISSAFVIPIIKQMEVKGETYSILTLESAITDVLCIVSAFTVMEIITLNSFDFQTMISKIAALFAIAGLVGVVAGIIWVVLVLKVFKEHKSYMITIAYLILVYAITEFLNGNGAIAALFFGLVLKNSKDIMETFWHFTKKQEGKEDNKKPKYAINATTETEEFFYSQISFFLKTFFFVYIGLLFDVSNIQILLIAGVIAIVIMISRMASWAVTKELDARNRKLIRSIFARGLAAAAIAQVVLSEGINGAELITQIVYAVIVFTIVLSSISIFFIKKDNKVAA